MNIFTYLFFDRHAWQEKQQRIRIVRHNNVSYNTHAMATTLTRWHSQGDAERGPHGVPTAGDGPCARLG